ncbi:MAG: Rrf2 family transcriptional regulator [Chloroflexota bacterium]|nr:MAG: Rrf2 family transcriptional regulator [Chloroflexota bacterium]
MILSTKGHYGLRAMTRLAETHGRQVLSLAEIAQAEGLPPAYLEQLVAPLRKAGLLKATRGVRGGYCLARHPAEITVGEVIRILEGPIGIVECASEVRSAGCCERETTCLSKPLWQRMRANIAQMLDSTTLADLSAGDAGSGVAEIAPEQDD